MAEGVSALGAYARALFECKHVRRSSVMVLGDSVMVLDSFTLLTIKMVPTIPTVARFYHMVFMILSRWRVYIEWVVACGFGGKIPI